MSRWLMTLFHTMISQSLMKYVEDQSVYLAVLISQKFNLKLMKTHRSIILHLPLWWSFCLALKLILMTQCWWIPCPPWHHPQFCKSSPQMMLLVCVIQVDNYSINSDCKMTSWDISSYIQLMLQISMDNSRRIKVACSISIHKTPPLIVSRSWPVRMNRTWVEGMISGRSELK